MNKEKRTVKSGGVDAATAPPGVAAGANVLVAGSRSLVRLKQLMQRKSATFCEQTGLTRRNSSLTPVRPASITIG
jgi:hypothetical protein